MMADVPKSDVVITNPTHYAVALKYEAKSMQAPKMLAKGVDKMALKIREVAAQHGIPIIENPPLARGLHASVEIDQEITPEFYKAVAEVIGYVFRLKRMRLEGLALVGLHRSRVKSGKFRGNRRGLHDITLFHGWRFGVRSECSGFLSFSH